MATDGFKIEGFIEIELVSTVDNVRKVYKNTITNGGKQFLLDKCASRMLSIAGDTFGMTTCSNVINKVGTNSTYPTCGSQSFQNRAITNVLLNMGALTTGLTGSTTFINVFDNTLTTPSKVVGYANTNVAPTADGKEGAIDYAKGVYVIDPYTVCERWMYGAGVATGAIDTIAMMPASCIKTNNGDGVQFSKCIDRINQQYINYASMSTGFLPPGIPGYTANDEILLNFSQDGVSKHRFSLTTGAITDITTDPFFVIGNNLNGLTNVTDIKLIGNYLYVLDQVQATGVQYAYPRVTVYDITASMAVKAQFNCNFLTAYEVPRSAKFLYFNSVLYVSTYTDKTVDGQAKLWTLSLGGNAWFSSTGAASTGFAALCTIPSGLTAANVAFGNYGSNYIMYVSSKLDGVGDYANTGYKAIGYVFTDMTNIGGTIIDIISGLNPNSVCYNAGSNLGWLRIGFDYWNTNYTAQFGDTYDYTDKSRVIANNSATVTIDTQSVGVFLTMDKWWTNVISFVVLTTPITKQATDVMYVSYGYKVV